MANWDEIFDQWARWVHQGALVPGGQSVLGKLIECQGVFGGGGGGGPVLDCIEADVEAAVLRLAAEDQAAATTFRMEYGAIGHTQDDTQLKRALRVGISLPTYKRRLKKARDHVIKALTKKRTQDNV
ncbi:hypothetical protein R7D97_25085 [Vibrio sp. Vb5031]|uniref:hypothetical protein n=1 Tax=Vibrio TaxID=662 RepID=UPI0011233F7C|nr:MULTISPECIES: hypothetical protein [Vibrio]MBY7933430.1 hypothetical protein [Vibrio fluvialis]ELA7323131.1 hypothetical protein [Vibrio parahaemolyticus]MBE3958858.1 hypothetical protein [Vibrio parahaemolyticus]MBO0165063.1 hypothetical protein [Vibrio alginolyticus]MCI9687446.1 hypothetical protein [Vibrio parahaemolyticus]